MNRTRGIHRRGRRTSADRSLSDHGRAARKPEFDFTVEGQQQHEYHVRCLPSNFPTWEYKRYLDPQHEFYVVTPTLAIGATAPSYAVIFDNNGVPVWWYTDSPAPPSDAKVLPEGTIAWWGSPPGGDAYEIRNLDGELLNAVRPVNGIIDPHDFQIAPNGDYLIITSELQTRQSD